MAVTDVMSLATAKDVVGVSLSDVSTQAKLARAIVAVSEYLDHNCGAVVRRTVTDELSAPSAGFLSLSVQPVASITTVTSYSGGASTVLTAETDTTAGEYRTVPFRGTPSGLLSARLVRRYSFYDTPWASPRGEPVLPVARVKVVYVAGRFVDTAAAEVSKFGAAAELLLRWFWQVHTMNVARQGDFDVPFPVFPSDDPPSAVRELLGVDWLTGRARSQIGTIRLAPWFSPGVTAPTRA